VNLELFPNLFRIQLKQPTDLENFLINQAAAPSSLVNFDICGIIWEVYLVKNYTNERAVTHNARNSSKNVYAEVK
jgi:hypothetical protein